MNYKHYTGINCTSVHASTHPKHRNTASIKTTTWWPRDRITHSVRKKGESSYLRNKQCVFASRFMRAKCSISLFKSCIFIHNGSITLNMFPSLEHNLHFNRKQGVGGGELIYHYLWQGTAIKTLFRLSTSLCFSSVYNPEIPITSAEKQQSQFSYEA